MNVQKISMNSNYRNVNFSGRVDKSLKDRIESDKQKDLLELADNATQRGVSVDLEKANAIKSQYDEFLNQLTTFMDGTHKDSVMIYKTIPWNYREAEIIYKNSKLKTERKIGSLYTPISILNYQGKFNKENWDEQLVNQALNSLELEAYCLKTRIGKQALLRQGKKIEKFEKETGMKAHDTSKIINACIQERKERIDRKKQFEKLEKQNRNAVK